MKKFFEKKEKTEEELKAIEEKKAKAKEIAVKVGKVAAGTLAFAGGVFLVLIAIGAANDSDPELPSTDATNDSVETEITNDEVVDSEE